VPYWTVACDDKSVQACYAFRASTLQISKVLLCALARKSDFWELGFARTQSHDTVLRSTSTGIE
jgi:hypothetical protein